MFTELHNVLPIEKSNCWISNMYVTHRGYCCGVRINIHHELNEKAYNIIGNDCSKRFVLIKINRNKFISSYIASFSFVKSTKTLILDLCLDEYILDSLSNKDLFFFISPCYDFELKVL